MFSGKTAWFSESCNAHAADSWVQHDGKLEVSDIAQFIFSDDWDHSDTKGFLTSQAYLKQHLAVLKSSYVSDAVRLGLPNIILGNYLLIPSWVEKRLSLARNVDIGRASKTSERAVRKRRSLPQTQSNTDTAQQADCLPHTSSQIDGMIGCDSCTNQDSSSSRTLVETSTQGSERIPAAPVNHPRSTVEQNPTQEPFNCSKPQKERESHNNRDYRDIIHVKDLPKVTDRLYTLDTKRDGVVIRQKYQH